MSINMNEISHNPNAKLIKSNAFKYPISVCWPIHPQSYRVLAINYYYCPMLLCSLTPFSYSVKISLADARIRNEDATYLPTLAYYIMIRARFAAASSLSRAAAHWLTLNLGGHSEIFSLPGALFRAEDRSPRGAARKGDARMKATATRLRKRPKREIAASARCTASEAAFFFFLRMRGERIINVRARESSHLEIYVSCIDAGGLWSLERV